MSLSIRFFAQSPASGQTRVDFCPAARPACHAAAPAIAWPQSSFMPDAYSQPLTIRFAPADARCGGPGEAHDFADFPRAAVACVSACAARAGACGGRPAASPTTSPLFLPLIV